MNAATPASIAAQHTQSALSGVLDPLTGKDWVSTRQLKHLSVANGVAQVDIALGYPARSQWPAYTALVQAALQG
ncbi:MAG: iron-sulfur cluster assembly protein, partial [Aquabacterium commune]|uniref:iron-sulfur cluster assembly protein n=1 Tax=Aquabacterium commune TaxID=70586 RepID=UPI003BB173BC